MKEEISNYKAFAVLMTISYILAIFGVFYNLKIETALFTLVLLVVFVLFFNLGFKKSLFLYLIFFLGIIRTDLSLNSTSVIDDIRAKDVLVFGQIISSKDINKKNNKVKFYLRADKMRIYNRNYDNIEAKILVNIDNKNDIDKKIKIGNYISLKGNLFPPGNSTNPYQFDYRQYLMNNGCKNIFYSKPNDFSVLKEAFWDGFSKDSWYFILRKFEETREKILLVHSKNIKSPKLEILGGIVFGSETINPDETIKENFKNSGLLHLLAASGLNVALIYGIWWWIANLIRFPYNFSILLGAFFVVLYTFMTGFPPSILRASIMLLFILFGKLIDRKANSVSLIFLVAFLILLFNPRMIFDIGFQLSFVVTFGLIFCCDVFIKKFDKINESFLERYKNLPRLKKYFFFLASPSSIAALITVPLIAQLWVVPLQMHYFNNFAPYSIFANILVVPFIGILSFVGFVSSIIALIPFLNEPVVYMFDFVANPLLILLLKISETFASFKHSLVTVGGVGVLQVFLFWIIIIFFTINLKQSFKNKKLFLIMIISTIIFILSFIRIQNFKHGLEIVMFDVGDADCFLIKTPKNKYILIDTGKRTYKGSTSAHNIINPYFRNEGIKKIELLIITHFDIDHSGGAIDILKNVKVNEVIIQNKQDKSNIAKEIYKYLNDSKISYKVGKNNETVYSEKDLILKTFIYRDEKIKESKKDNLESIMSLLNYKDKNILFMADADIQSFRGIKNLLPPKIDILKVGHHGAQGTINAELTERIRPDYALISAGQNHFDHPHYSTLELLYNIGAKVISSKNYGFVKIILDDKNNFVFKHFDFESKKIKNIVFIKKDRLPFFKSEYVKKLIKENI